MSLIEILSAAPKLQVDLQTSLPNSDFTALKSVPPNSMRPKFVLYAPNVHTGGGLVLLRDLLASWPKENALRAILDARAFDALTYPFAAEVSWVAPRIVDRLRAEFLARRSGNADAATILCFHGLPPLFPTRGNVVIFVQNRLLLEQDSLAKYPLRVRIRLWVERLWFGFLQGRCSHYIVQTRSMAVLLKQALKREVRVSVIPFAPAARSKTTQCRDIVKKKYDFVYVASGELHKNHFFLLEAWKLLAEEGLYPSLVLTINSDAYPAISIEILKCIDEIGLNVINVGELSSAEIYELYRSSSALIYPSRVESFGLPLIEASQLGLPILASELDYVRDIVSPDETFDPNSSISIFRAVKRFLNVSEEISHVYAANDFLTEVIK